MTFTSSNVQGASSPIFDSLVLKGAMSHTRDNVKMDQTNSIQFNLLSTHKIKNGLDKF